MMKVPKSVSLILLALGCVAPSAAQPQYVDHPDRAAAVAEAFQRSWDGYYQYAFPNDSLKPISRTSENDRNGWGASAIDAITTALVMGKKGVVKQIVDFIPTINWNVTSSEISVFETTIRYLGGLLSAHDFLTGELSDLADDTALVDEILKQSIALGDMLKIAFDTPSGVPINTLLNDPIRKSNDTTNGLATIGTLVLEWTRLSDKSGNPEYGQLAQKGESYLLNPQPKDIAEPFPGLVGTDVAVSNGSFLDSVGGWNGGTDSYYEYLIKMYLYDSSRFSEYKDRWVPAIDSSIEYLTSHPTSRPDLTFLAYYRNSSSLVFRSGHLACFHGGNFILGGLTLDRQDYIDFGLGLVNGCRATYNQTLTGIGPEGFAWQDDKVVNNASNPTPPPDQAEFYNRTGFWFTSPGYYLRPEVIESYYYAYRATGNTKYQDWAWEAFVNINRTCSAGAGFSEITDTNAPNGGSYTDFQDSFWFAEVLKYSYLIQAPEAPWQISAVHDNQWVWNTEAHPFKVAGTPI